MLSIITTGINSIIDTSDSRKSFICKDLRCWKILDKMLDMEENEIIERLEGLIFELQRFRQEILDGAPVFPQSAQDLLDARTCLVCKNKIEANEPAFRGNHEKHYRQVMRAIERGELTENQAIARGLLAPQATPGRKRIALEEQVRAAHDVKQAEQKLTKRRQKRD